MENCTEFAPIGRIFGERVPAFFYSVIRDVYFLAYCNPIGPNPSKKPKTSTKREIILIARNVERTVWPNSHFSRFAVKSNREDTKYFKNCLLHALNAPSQLIPAIFRSTESPRSAKPVQIARRFNRNLSSPC